MPATTTSRVNVDDQGGTWIADTNVKAVEVAMDMIAHGWSPGEIHFQHPHHSLAQIHVALGDYYDHQPEMDALIQTQFNKARMQRDDSPLRKRLREMRKLR